MSTADDDSRLARAYRAILPARVRGPLWRLRARAAKLAASGAARRDLLADVLVAFGRPVRWVRAPHAGLWVDLRDYGVGRKVFVHSRYEEDEAAVLRESLKPGMTYLDVGGNLGYLATLAAKCVGPTGLVVAVEPEPYNFSLLERNLRSVSRGRGVAVNAAAGGAPGTATLFKADSNLGDHRLYSDDATTSRAGVQVPVVRLDELFAANNWPAPDFVKIDVQGFETHVVAGLGALADGGKLRTVLTEYWPIGIRSAGGDPAAYLDWFRSRGFACYLIGPDAAPALLKYEEVDSHLPPFDPEWPDAQMLNLVFRR